MDGKVDGGEFSGMIEVFIWIIIVLEQTLIMGIGSFNPWRGKTEIITENINFRLQQPCQNSTGRAGEWNRKNELKLNSNVFQWSGEITYHSKTKIEKNLWNLSFIILQLERVFLRQGDKYFLKLELLDSFESQVGGGRRPEGRTVQGGNYHVNTKLFGIFCYLQYQNID